MKTRLKFFTIIVGKMSTRKGFEPYLSRPGRLPRLAPR
nr:MAG TPA: hypothetical protein [Caudoviricetes sp.]